MKIATFNIRYDTPQDGVNRFCHRSGMILNKIESERPDVIGFQECRPHVFDFIKRHLTDYAVVGCGRGADYEDEHNPIAFLKEKYELIGLETEWLSPTPETPGSRYPEQSPCPRIVTRATLRPNGTANPFYVFNTHLDHQSEEARVLGARQLIALMRARVEKRAMPLLLLGDFNAYPGSEPVAMLISDKALSLTDHTSGVPHSYHGYKRPDQMRIDYIMSRGFRAIGKPQVWNDCLDGVFLSDHYPIAIELETE